MKGFVLSGGADMQKVPFLFSTFKDKNDATCAIANLGEKGIFLQWPFR